VGAEHDRRGLPFLALDRDEPHGRSLCRLADRFGIRRIILLPLHERPRKPFKPIVVALANKIPRTIWALLVKGGVYNRPIVALAA